MQSACAVLYNYLWPVWLYHIFPHYLINGTIFGKLLLNIKCVFWFSVQLLSETFLILRRIQRDIIINVHRSLCKLPLLLSDFNETWIFSTDFRKKKSSNIKFYENPSIVSRVVPCGRTDMTKLIVAFRNFANAPKNVGSRFLQHVGRYVPNCTESHRKDRSSLLYLHCPCLLTGSDVVIFSSALVRTELDTM
jgi:hypothetical protein